MQKYAALEVPEVLVHFFTPRIASSITCNSRNKKHSYRGKNASLEVKKSVLKLKKTPHSRCLKIMF